MKIQPTQTTFQYNSQLKTLWRKGKLPTVTKGFYGDKLTQKNVSLEHLKPHSQGGHTNLENLVLASKEKNWQRGNDDLRNYANKKLITDYLAQFIDVVVDTFDGNKYIKGVIKTLNKLGVL